MDQNTCVFQSLFSYLKKTISLACSAVKGEIGRWWHKMCKVWHDILSLQRIWYNKKGLESLKSLLFSRIHDKLFLPRKLNTVQTKGMRFYYGKNALSTCAFLSFVWVCVAASGEGVFRMQSLRRLHIFCSILVNAWGSEKRKLYSHYWWRGNGWKLP